MAASQERDRQTDEQTDRQTDRQPDSQTEARETGREETKTDVYGRQTVDFGLVLDGLGAVGIAERTHGLVIVVVGRTEVCNLRSVKLLAM